MALDVAEYEKCDDRDAYRPFEGGVGLSKQNIWRERDQTAEDVGSADGRSALQGTFGLGFLEPICALRNYFTALGNTFHNMHH